MNVERLTRAWLSARSARDLARLLLELARGAARDPFRIRAALRTVQTAIPRSDLTQVQAELESQPEPPELVWLRTQVEEHRAAIEGVEERRRALAELQARRARLEQELANLREGARS